jgi:hypothetical protein
MAINATDVQIMRPERVTDNDDGGGQMTGTAIASGDVNNLWDDIPRTMLAYGGVSLRKLFCAIRSANVDKFLGGHTIIQSDSIADNVSTLLFSTGDHYDERDSAQDSIERFVVLGTRSPLRPVGTQREGQSAVVMYGDDESAAPKIGEVVVFKDDINEQYIKVSAVTASDAKYTYEYNNSLLTYSATEFIIQISQPLEYDFVGADPSPTAEHSFDVYKTQTSALAKYYGIKPLAADVFVGDSTVKADGIFQSIVPTATTETALLDQKPGLSVRVLQPTSTEAVVKNMGSLSGSVALTLANSFTPGSLKITVGTSVYKDAGNYLQLTSGTSRLDDDLTTIDGISGVLNLSLSSSAIIVVSYIPAVAVELLPYTESVEIDLSNRQLTYVDQLSPAPMAGSLRVEYQYLGEWYELTDDGNGVISGDGATGVVSYDTGSCSFVLAGEPDAGSSLIYTWARSPYDIDDAVSADSASAHISIPLPSDSIAGTAILTWESNGIKCTASEQPDQTITGDGVGRRLGYNILLCPDSNLLPDTDIAIVYSKRAASAINLTRTIDVQTGGDLAIDLGDTNIDASSVELTLVVAVAVDTTIKGVVSSSAFSSTLNFQGRSDNALVQLNKNGFGSSVDDVVGSIDAATGIVTVDCDKLNQKVKDFTYTSEKKRITYIEFKSQKVLAQTAEISYHNTFSPTAESYTVAFSDLAIELPLGQELLVPGAMAFDLGGGRITDRGDGALYKDWNEQTAAGIKCGDINYATAEMSLSYPLLKSDLADFDCNIIALASGLAAASAVSSVVFRTQASPLRPSGLQFLARRITDTALLRAESENDGSISGVFDSNDVLGELAQPSMSSGYNLPIVAVDGGAGSATGSVDYETGIVKLEFSQPVVLSSLTYNAVAYNSVPLDSEILGLNPIKLPTNGQVPIFQPGYIVVIHNEKTIEIASPSANQIIDCERTLLSQVSIADAAGLLLDDTQYSVDKKTGLVTLADPFVAQTSDATALTMPLTLTHRVEDICAVARVSIDGSLSLMTQVIHDYSAGDSFVSSAIQFTTMQARVHTQFTQKIDDSGYFDDVLVGDATVASYDDINYPILIDNKSSVQERWKIKFTNNTGFELIGETLGLIAVGSTTVDFSPINPMTDAPYFTIKSDGWGSGWVTNNILRFNTDAAAKPIWAIRTVLPSTAPVEDDFINIEFRGDAD